MFHFHLLRTVILVAALTACAAAQTTEGPRIFSGSNSTEIVSVKQGGSGFALQANTPSTGPIGAVFGLASGASGFTNGVWGRSFSTAGVGVRGEAMATSGAATGVAGFTSSRTGIGVFGHANFNGFGVVGRIDSQDNSGAGVMGIAGPTCCGIPGLFEQDATNGGGFDQIIVGQFLNSSNQIQQAFVVTSTSVSAPQYTATSQNGSDIYLGKATNGLPNVFRVDHTGAVFADGGVHTTGADFAEALPVKGVPTNYSAGDVLTIDASSQNRLTRTAQPYSTLVAGIYSTKPGLLGGSEMQAGSKTKVPLAVVGIVPCKVTVSNGPVHTGDLLVTSDKPGYAMKGTDRSKMIGAVVGKALEPLATGDGLIHVLVTLQ